MKRKVEVPYFEMTGEFDPCENLVISIDPYYKAEDRRIVQWSHEAALKLQEINRILNVRFSEYLSVWKCFCKNVAQVRALKKWKR